MNYAQASATADLASMPSPSNPRRERHTEVSFWSLFGPSAPNVLLLLAGRKSSTDEGVY